MPTITEVNNSSNSLTTPSLKMDEFLPIVKFKNPSKYVVKDEELILSQEEITLSKYLDSDKRSFKILQLTTNKEKIELPFQIKKGSTDSWDDDGYLEPKLSIESEKFKIASEIKILKKYDDEFEVEIDLKGEKSNEFYLDFYANDDEDEFNKGEYENVHCGRVKIIYRIPNEWEFSKEKIEAIKTYAIANNVKYNGPGDANRYHHCTDTHKNIISKLLDNPSDLSFGKDQNHLPSANRLTPNDFKKAGEATTQEVRNKTITATYAELSKTFTVVDIDDNEVLNSNGTAGNTDKELKSFTQSPVAYMKNKCPENGYYVFIGAYNDDYHSFSIVVKKEEENYNFQFIDQMVGVVSYTENNLENSKLLINIDDYAFDFPMKLELYQLRNNKK